MDLSPFKTRRFWLIMSVLLVVHLLIFFQLRDLDMSWLIPAVKKRLGWPDLPGFHAQETTTADGQKEIYYTVPTHQLTAQERAAFQQTNAPPAKVR